MKSASVRRGLNSAAAVLFTVSLFFLILTLSIGLPIYIRPFYYAHIEAMQLPAASGFSAEQIREAYDEVLDYLTLPGREFSAGEMAFSRSGADHFADCKLLFDLNAAVLIASGLCLLVLLVLRRRGILSPFRLGCLPAASTAAVSAVALPIVVGGLAALDFDRAFVIFHGIFFPGKENWIFDPRVDEIIRVLPQDFFMHCAILIGAGVVVFSLAVLIVDSLVRRAGRRGSAEEKTK